jgi:hypothetical protein
MSENGIQLQRRRRKGWRARYLERIVFCGLIVLVGGAAMYVTGTRGPSGPTPDQQVKNAQRFSEELKATYDLQLGELRNQLRKSQEEMEALRNKPAPVDEAGRREHEKELAAAKQKNDDLEKRIKGLEESKKNIETAANNYTPPTTPPGGGTSDAPKTNVDLPTPDPTGHKPAEGTPGDPNNVPGKKDGINPTAALAVAAAAFFPELIPILAALGIGGDLFGTDHKDGPKVVAQVRKMFEEGAELKVEAAVNKLADEHWTDPTEAIGKIRGILSHAEMKKRLGEAKVTELRERLEELEKLFASHGDILRLVGREATLRLLRELPPILVADGASAQRQAKEKFKALLKPFGGLRIQADVWKQNVLGAYITSAASGSALASTSSGLRPFKIAETEYVTGLRKMLEGAKPKQQDAPGGKKVV